MNKILIKLSIPMIEKQYDVRIPDDKKLYQIIYMLIKAVDELNDRYYLPENSPVLYEKWSSHRYNINLTAKENQIKNGAEIILI